MTSEAQILCERCAFMFAPPGGEPPGGEPPVEGTRCPRCSQPWQRPEAPRPRAHVLNRAETIAAYELLVARQQTLEQAEATAMAGFGSDLYAGATSKLRAHLDDTVDQRCRACGGTGRRTTNRCQACDGTGEDPAR